MGVPVRGRGNKKEPGPGKQIPMLLWPFVGTQRTSCCRRASMRRCEAWGLERLLPFGRVKPCASKLRSHCSLVFWCDRRYMSSVKRFSPKTSSLRTPKPKLNVPGFPQNASLVTLLRSCCQAFWRQFAASRRAEISGAACAFCALGTVFRRTKEGHRRKSLTMACIYIYIYVYKYTIKNRPFQVRFTLSGLMLKDRHFVSSLQLAVGNSL